MEQSTGAKQRLLETVVDMLVAGQDVGGVTTRALAAEAGANPALINYYFGGKEGLLHAAVDHCMAEVFDTIVNGAGSTHPVERVKEMAKAISDVAFANPAISRLALQRDTQHGCSDTVELLLPLLRELYDGVRDENTLRVLATQLVLPMQVVWLNHQEYGRFFNIDIADSEARHKLLNEMVDALLTPPYATAFERRSLWISTDT